MTSPTTRMSEAARMDRGWLTQRDVMNAHAEHGLLDWHLVKKGMGPNWPAEWELLGPGEGIFAPEEDRTP